MRRWSFLLLSVVLLSAGWVAPSNAAMLPRADGLGACTSADPPFPYHGSCGTFSNRNTFYGSYGPGFPSPLGWGFCAFEAAHGGWYPAPGYNYALGTPPAGVDPNAVRGLGWAMSEAERLHYWDNGSPGLFSADDVAVAGKLLYDNVAWGAPLPSLSGTLRRALLTLQGLLATGQTVTATPTVTVRLRGGGPTIDTSGTVDLSVLVPGTNAPLANQPLVVTLTNAVTSDTAATSVTVTTDANGTASVALVVPDGLPTTVGVRVVTTLAQPGMLFYDPGMFPNDAQILASNNAPLSVTKTLSVTALGDPKGTLQIQKTVDDAAYYPPSGAVFQILDNTDTVLDTLTTDANGLSNQSVKILQGTYILRELTPPAGYAAMADRPVTVVARTNTVVPIGPADGDVIARASLTLTKLDRPLQFPLAGAVYSLTYDTSNSGVADGTPVTCTTDDTGTCTFANLLPGRYLVREVTPPPNYLPNALSEWITLAPGDVQYVTYEDDPALVQFAVHKFNAATVSAAIPSATYDLYVALPAPPGLLATPPLNAVNFPSLGYVARGVTNAHGQLTFTVRAGYRWCVREVAAPDGYVVDPGLHCTTQPIVGLRPALAAPEHASSIRLDVYKFNANDPTAGVPHAYYALFVRNPFPPGFTPAPPTPDVTVPNGTSLWAIGESNQLGQLHFYVPSGFVWCVQELYAPSTYELDPGLHCTVAPLTTSSPTSVTHLALAELAYTGPSPVPITAGLLSALSGFALLANDRRRRRR